MQIRSKNMTLEAKPEITGRFTWFVPQIVIPAISALAEGEDANALCEEVARTLKGDFGYNEETKTMWGNSLPIAARVDSIVRPLGIRVATLADLSRAEVVDKVKGKYFSVVPGLVLGTLKDRYAPNAELIPNLRNHVEQAQGILRLPALVTGFDVVPADNQYGWEFTPRDDFKVLEDERFGIKYNRKTFTEADEIGLPMFDRKGSRTWYSGGQGLSKLFLSSDFSLRANDGYLDSSSEIGRVVLVSGKAAGTDLRQAYARKG